MLDVAEVAVVALAAVVVVIGLVLRLRQDEPAAVARVGQRLAQVRAELAAAEATLADRASVLAPLQEERAALERSVAAQREAAAAEHDEHRRRDRELADELAERAAEHDRLAEALVRTQAELEAAQGALAELRAMRAEAEAALRDARRSAQHSLQHAGQQVGQVEQVEQANQVERQRAPAEGRRTAQLDLAAIVAEAGDEPSIITTDGAVRPTGALPVDQEQTT